MRGFNFGVSFSTSGYLTRMSVWQHNPLHRRTITFDITLQLAVARLCKGRGLALGNGAHADAKRASQLPALQPAPVLVLVLLTPRARESAVFAVRATALL